MFSKINKYGYKEKEAFPDTCAFEYFTRSDVSNHILECCSHYKTPCILLCTNFVAYQNRFVVLNNHKTNGTELVMNCICIKKIAESSWESIYDSCYSCTFQLKWLNCTICELLADWAVDMKVRMNPSVLCTRRF